MATTPFQSKYPELFTMGGKQLRSLAENKRTALGKAAAAEIARRKANALVKKGK